MITILILDGNDLTGNFDSFFDVFGDVYGTSKDCIPSCSARCLCCKKDHYKYTSDACSNAIDLTNITQVVTDMVATRKVTIPFDIHFIKQNHQSILWWNLTQNRVQYTGST